MTPTPSGSLDVTDVLPAERRAFVELLSSLDDDDWRRPTECPAYDVQGVATHVLGDDLSLLSRQRDGAPNGLIGVLQPGDDFRTALDRFNDRWVEAAHFFSPSLLVELLELTGQWTTDWYRSVDPESLGEPVGFFAASGPSPYWQVAAREFVERWVHHHQVRRAVERPNIDDTALLEPAVAAVVRSLAAHLRDLDTGPDDSVVLAVEGLASWTLVRDSDGWQVFDGRPEEPNAQLRLERSLAAPAVTRGLPPSELEAAFMLEGDRDLAARAANRIAVLAGR